MSGGEGFHDSSRASGVPRGSRGGVQAAAVKRPFDKHPEPGNRQRQQIPRSASDVYRSPPPSYRPPRIPGNAGGAATATPPPPGWRHEEEFSGDGEEGGEGAEIPAGLLGTTTPPGALFPAEHAFTEEERPPRTSRVESKYQRSTERATSGDAFVARLEGLAVRVCQAASLPVAAGALPCVYFGPLSARVTPRPLVHARQGYPLSLVCEAAGGAATPGSLPPPHSQIVALWTHAPLGHTGPPRALLDDEADEADEEEGDGGLPSPRRRWGASREEGGCAWGARRASVLALRSATLQDAGSFACVLLALARGHRVLARAVDVVRVEVGAAPAPSIAPIAVRLSPASPLFVPPGGDATLWCSVDSSSLSEVSVSWSVADAAASSWTPLLGLRSDGEPWVHERSRRRHALGRLCPDAAPCGPDGRLHRLVLRAFGVGDQGRYACEVAGHGALGAGRLMARDEVLVLLLLDDGETEPSRAPPLGPGSATRPPSGGATGGPPAEGGHSGEVLRPEDVGGGALTASPGGRERPGPRAETPPGGPLGPAAVGSLAGIFGCLLVVAVFVSLCCLRRRYWPTPSQAGAPRGMALGTVS
ncbi:uncharacterized protein LOC144946564 [Lampetra fluviatilis]